MRCLRRQLFPSIPLVNSLPTGSALAYQHHVVECVQVDGVMVGHRPRRPAAAKEAVLQHRGQMFQIVAHQDFQIFGQ